MCPHEESLTAWLLGDLTPHEREEVGNHVAHCPHCRAVAEEIKPVLAMLKRALAKDLPAPQTHVTPSVPFPALKRHPSRFVPREMVRRAALLIASFGTVFLLISGVYRMTSRDRLTDSSTTHITFQKPEPIPPPLVTVTPKQAEKTDGLADFHPDAVHPPPSAPLVSAPAPPSQLRITPKIYPLVSADRAKDEPSTASHPQARLSDEARLDEYAEKKSKDQKRPRNGSVAKKASPAKLTARPLTLGSGTPPAALAASCPSISTNTASTNATPTNAVSTTATNRIVKP